MRSLSFVLAIGLMGAVVVATAQAGPVKVGEKAPNFKATSVAGKTITLGDAKGADVTVLCFTCNNCPVAKSYEDRFVQFVKKYGGKNVKFFAINVNKNENLAAMKKRVDEKGLNYVYAYDETGDSAKAYGAKVTPHLFVVDGKGKVQYIGAFDDNMNAKKVKKHHVSTVVDALLAGKKPPVTETRAFGCAIKR